VLKNVSLFCSAGKTTFIVGRSGSGKSTIGHLLVRFYVPLEGEIRVDNRPLPLFNLKALRQSITLVEQKSRLFDESIAQNIALGSNEQNIINIEDVKMAADFASLTQTLDNMPDGIFTEIGRNGTYLSGGQRQRIAIARAKLRNSPVLILDESISALDTINQSRIMEVIKAWRKDKTTIIITHNLSLIKEEDYVYVLDRGILVQESYWHSILRGRGNIFQQLILQQADNERYETGQSLWMNNRIDYEEQRENSRVSTTPSISKDYITSVIQSSPRFDPVRSMPSSRYSKETTGIAYFNSYYDSEAGTPVLYETYQGANQSYTSPLSLASTSHFTILSPVALSPYLGDGQTTTPRDFLRNSVSRLNFKMQSELQNRGALKSSVGSNITTMDQLISMSEQIPAKRRKQRRSGSQNRHIGLGISGVSAAFSGEPVGSEKLPVQSTPLSQHDLIKILAVKDILATIWNNLHACQKFKLAVGVIFGTVHASATPIFSFVFSKLLSTFFVRDNADYKSIVYSGIILGLAVIDGFSSFLFRLSLESCSEIWTYNIRRQAFKAIINQPREFFDTPKGATTALVEALDHQTEDMRAILSRFTANVFIIFLVFIIAIVWSATICWKLTLVTLATAPVVFTIQRLLGAVTTIWGRKHAKIENNLYGVVSETFTSVQTIRCLTLEPTFLGKHEAINTDLMRVGLRKATFTGAVYGASTSLILLITALLFYYGNHLAVNNSFAVHDILTSFTILLMSFSFINSLSTFIPSISISQFSASQVLSLTSLPITSHENSGNVRITSIGTINLRNLTFAYPTRPHVPALNNVTLEIEPGCCIAIVGSSGSGKSTIASLLLKLYATHSIPTASANREIFKQTGALTVACRDIRRLHTHTLRSLIAIVPQNPFLFPGTIKENIAYGLSPSNPFTSSASVREAAAAAGIADFIDSLENGYDTIVGEGGLELSGGQMQRIAIARALVRKPSCLIIDEATSALDAESVEIIKESIRKLVNMETPFSPVREEFEFGNIDRDVGGRPVERSVAGGGYGRVGGLHEDPGGKGKGIAVTRERKGCMTVIIITHAKEMMSLADEIVVLERGRVVERGRFEELSQNRSGTFARLAKAINGWMED
jgi:ATP-binding cassette, subfamily B (MDR/TAP), member 1